MDKNLFVSIVYGYNDNDILYYKDIVLSESWILNSVISSQEDIDTIREHIQYQVLGNQPKFVTILNFRRME